MLLRGVLGSRGEPGDEIDPGDLFLFFDNSHHYHMQQLLNCMTTSQGNKIPKESRQVYLTYDEESTRLRKGCVRSGTALDLVEHLMLVSRSELATTLPHAKRLAIMLRFRAIILTGLFLHTSKHGRLPINHVQA